MSSDMEICRLRSHQIFLVLGVLIRNPVYAGKSNASPEAILPKRLKFPLQSKKAPWRSGERSLKDL